MILIFVEISIPFGHFVQTWVNWGRLNYNHDDMYRNEYTSSCLVKDPIATETLTHRDIASNLLGIFQPKYAYQRQYEVTKRCNGRNNCEILCLLSIVYI